MLEAFSPNIYFIFTTTVPGSKFILAVDRSPSAPVFETADIGIAGDLQEVLPLLTSKVKAVKGA